MTPFLHCNSFVHFVHTFSDSTYNFKDLLKLPKGVGMPLYFTVQNAFTFTKCPSLNLEIQANTNDARGVDISSELPVGIDCRQWLRRAAYRYANRYRIPRF